MTRPSTTRRPGALQEPPRQTDRVHEVAERNARRFLAVADRLFGSRLVGFYVVGSAARGGFVPARSDLDFVAVVDPPDRGDCRRARLAQVASGVRTAAPALLRGRTAGPGSCNGVYLSADQLQRPVTRITPIASHHGVTFERSRAFDVNPVVWKTFAEHGVALRGPGPADLGLDPEPHLLRQWNIDNLNGYWRSCAAATMAGRPPLKPWVPARWATAWTVLGPARLHRTIATGDVVSKQEAGRYALEVFAPEWHPIIEEALAYWDGAPADPAFDDARARHERSGTFALHVIDSANAL